MKALLVVTGNEILQGRTLDYNSYWISKRLTGLDIEVKRKVTVPDEKKEIKKAIQRGIERGWDLIITVGGLGPTPRDTTLNAVADALERELELNKQALQFIRQSYERLHQLGFVDSPSITESRRKMARLPEEAKPVKNMIGTSPAVVTPYNDTLILSFPGVPSEMMYTLEQSIPLFSVKSEEGVVRTRELYIEKRDESELAQAFEKVMNEFEGIEIKSYPTGYGKEMKMRVIAIAHGKNVSKVEKRLNKALSLFERLFKDERGEL